MTPDPHPWPHRLVIAAAALGLLTVVACLFLAATT